jgi:hypothetical protein
MENTTQIKLPACSSGQSLGQCIDATVSSFMTQTSAPPNSACVIVSAQYRGATIYAQGYGKISNNGPAPTTANSFQIDSLTLGIGLGAATPSAHHLAMRPPTASSVARLP